MKPRAPNRSTPPAPTLLALSLAALALAAVALAAVALVATPTPARAEGTGPITPLPTCGPGDLASLAMPGLAPAFTPAVHAYRIPVPPSGSAELAATPCDPAVSVYARSVELVAGQAGGVWTGDGGPIDVVLYRNWREVGRYTIALDPNAPPPAPQPVIADLVADGLAPAFDPAVARYTAPARADSGLPIAVTVADPTVAVYIQSQLVRSDEVFAAWAPAESDIDVVAYRGWTEVARYTIHVATAPSASVGDPRLDAAIARYPGLRAIIDGLPKPPPGPGDAPEPPCASDNDCQDGDSCWQGTCVFIECKGDSACAEGEICVAFQCVEEKGYTPPSLTPILLPKPPTERDPDDDPPVWHLPDPDDPFGDIPPVVPEACGDDPQHPDLLCCTSVTGWSFEKDDIDGEGHSLYQAWSPSGGAAFARGPVYGNNVHVARIHPPGFSDSAMADPATHVGGDYWAFSRDVNQQGKWWIGSSDTRSSPTLLPGSRIAENAAGTLHSPEIRVESDYIRFFLGGDSLPSERVQLEIRWTSAADKAALEALYDGIGPTELSPANQAAVTPTNPAYVVVRASAPMDDDEFMHRRVAWDVRPFLHRIGRIVVVDEDRHEWRPGHVNVDEVVCTDELEDAPTWRTRHDGAPSSIGESLTPIPLWGTTDTHTHPFSNLAFAGFVGWGDPSDSLADVYNCHHALPAIEQPVNGGTLVIRPEIKPREPEACWSSDGLNAIVASLPCEAVLAFGPVGIPIVPVCETMKIVVLSKLAGDVPPLIEARSLHGSPSALSGGFQLVNVANLLSGIDPFLDMVPGAPNLSAMSLPENVPGLIERLAWDDDHGGHTGHGIRGHQLYQKDMLLRAWQGGLRLIGVDVIDSRMISAAVDLGARYDEWRVIRTTTLAVRRLVSCGQNGVHDPGEDAAGDDPLFPQKGVLCDIAGIARSPEAARELIAADKIAIVLGTETDELGIPRSAETLALFGHPDDDPATADESDSAELQVQDLWDLGIRKVTPIHAMNNPLGGAGIFNDTYLTGGNELSNLSDPHKRAESWLRIPLFVSPDFNVDLLDIAQWETDPGYGDSDWYSDHGGWVALDLAAGSDWIGGGVTFAYGFESLKTPLGFMPTPGQAGGAPAFHPMGTWAGVNEVKHLNDVAQLVKGGDLCNVEGAGLPLEADASRLPADVQLEHIITADTGQANAVGLRPEGGAFIQRLMSRGMIIDLDHLSQRARVQVRELAEQLGTFGYGDADRLYPFLGVHTDVREISRHGPIPDAEDLRADRGFTAETDRTRPEFERGHHDGGVFSPGANGSHVADSVELEAQVRNDCDYSSKSFALKYLWMVGVMGGHGIAPSTDMSPFFGPAAPRFGQNQCHMRTSYHDDMRLSQEEAEDDEVIKWCPPDGPGVPVLESCKVHKFPHDWDLPDPSLPDGTEKFVQSALCPIWGRLLPQCKTYQILQEQLAEGAGVVYEDYAAREHVPPPAQVDDGEGLVEYVVARQPGENRDDGAPRARVPEIVGIGRARQMWPMKKMKTSAGLLKGGTNTGWDVNLDGFQHIGLFPDYLQDVRNVGVSWERMTPLFDAAEDYVRIWERACQLADLGAANSPNLGPGCHPAAPH